MEDSRSRKEHKALRVAAIAGLAPALTVDLFCLLAFYPGMPRDNPWGLPLILLTCAIQTLLTIAGAALFAWVHIRLKVNLWLAVPYGLSMRALLGGISLGVAIGIRQVFAVPAGRLTFVGEHAYLNAASPWRHFREGFLGVLPSGWSRWCLARSASWS